MKARYIMLVVLCASLSGCAMFLTPAGYAKEFHAILPPGRVEEWGEPDSQTTWNVTDTEYLTYRWDCVDGERVSITWKAKRWMGGTILETVSDVRTTSANCEE